MLLSKEYISNNLFNYFDNINNKYFHQPNEKVLINIIFVLTYSNVRLASIPKVDDGK